MINDYGYEETPEVVFLFKGNRLNRIDEIPLPTHTELRLCIIQLLGRAKRLRDIESVNAMTVYIHDVLRSGMTTLDKVESLQNYLRK